MVMALVLKKLVNNAYSLKSTSRYKIHLVIHMIMYGDIATWAL